MARERVIGKNSGLYRLGLLSEAASLFSHPAQSYLPFRAQFRLFVFHKSFLFIPAYWFLLLKILKHILFNTIYQNSILTCNQYKIEEIYIPFFLYFVSEVQCTLYTSSISQFGHIHSFAYWRRPPPLPPLSLSLRRWYTFQLSLSCLSTQPSPDTPAPLCHVFLEPSAWQGLAAVHRESHFSSCY